jgi:preprotein translocase subunit YajC
MMNWLIPAANAATPGAAPGADLIQLGMIIVLFVVFYMLIIRPQRKRQKEHQSLIANLTAGDEVSTNAGILGKVRKVEGDYVIVKVAENVELKFQKVAILAVLPKGTLKAIE